MKRLLLMVALALPALGLYSCVTRVHAPTPNVIVQEAHEAFPEAAEPQITKAPNEQQDLLKAPRADRHVRRHRTNPVAPHQTQPAVPSPRPHRPKAPVAKSPLPQQDVVEAPASLPCIFPFIWEPQCTPGANQ